MIKSIERSAIQRDSHVRAEGLEIPVGYGLITALKPLLVGLVMSVGFCAVPVQAEEQSILLQVGTKLSRGAANLVTGWIEVPKQIYRVGREEGWLIGVVRGPIDGVGMCTARTLAGAYEILSFPLPLPFQYQPMLQPEYVWQADRIEVPASSFESP